MISARRLSMVVLVLLNLGFVLITEAARWTWLGPLFALTLASPWLVPLTRHLLYRLAWNAAILATFALLVHHVTRAGAQHLLEDGLLLAGLCQVHLLNNITEKQRPDLLFFNSFLIVVVTSFLCFDYPFCLLFVAYVPALVIALELETLHRTGASLARPALRAVVRRGLGRAAILLAATFAVFFFWPRDFRRRGFVRTIELNRSAPLARVGFNDRIQLGSSLLGVEQDDRVVMRIRLQQGAYAHVPTYWRGATLDRFNGAAWRPARRPAVLHPWKRTKRLAWKRGRGPVRDSAVLDVELVAPASARLFVPLQATGVKLAPPPEHWRRVMPQLDLTLAFDHSVLDRRDRRFEVTVGTLDPPAIRARKRVAARNLRTHLQLPRALPPGVHAAAGRILGSITTQDTADLVEAVRRHLATNLRYLPPGTPGAARGLQGFLAGEGGGHCEHFATALAVLLRTARVPCRVVTGFHSQEWDSTTRTLTVRARHAHAWVEVFDVRRGWTTVDATPAGEGTVADTTGGLFSRARIAAARLWSWIAGFNEAGQQRVVAWVAGLPGRYPVETSLIAAALVGLATLRTCRRRRRHEPPVVRRYRRAVRRARLTLRPGETPRERLARAQREPIDPDRLEILATATACLERERYGG